MENIKIIPIYELKKKLNNKKAIIDFFREQGMQKALLFKYRFILPKFLVI